MPEASQQFRPHGKGARDFALLLLVLGVAVLALFYHSFEANLALASNDAPLGLINAQSGRDASTVSGLFTGYWQDLNWLGIEQPSVLPSLSFGLYMIFGDPITNAKFYAPISLIFVGFCAWFFFRQLGFRNSVCVLCGLAASLNMNSFSNACWGLPTRALTQGSIFLALAALQSAMRGRFWLKAVLAGLAVGFAVMEGFDVGAIYSLFVAAFAFFLIVASSGKSFQQAAPKGIAFVAVIAICAGWLSAHALNTLIGTQITGVSGMAQDQGSKQQRWNEATQWSLPKIETSRVLVPGLFGYRMEPNPSRYWGDVGQAAGTTYTRHSGSGEYAGILVVLVAAWGVASAFRKAGGALTVLEKRWGKFWLWAALIALVLSWGRHAPFYQIVYSFPYFSTIRNPIKFMHIFHLCLLVLFGFGLEEIFRSSIARANTHVLGLADQLKSWWKAANGFERKWVYGVVGFGLASVFATFVFISSNHELSGHLKAGGFNDQEIPQIIAFSTHELWLYLLFYAVSLGVILIALSGWFSGGRLKIGVALMGLIIFVDLARANMPWIQYYNYKERYSSNPVIDLLKEKTRDQRASFRLAPFAGVMFVNPKQVPWWDQLVFIWHQQLFQYFNIPSLEPTQMPRIPELDSAFFQNFLPRTNQENYLISRMWELTGTRYFLGQTGFSDALNSEYDPGKNRVRNNAAFNIVPKANSSKTGGMGIDDITAEITTNGTFSVMEFTGALPRVKLFNAWQTPPNDPTTLQMLRAPDFDPNQRVLVAASGETLPAPAAVGTNVSATATFGKYKPKDFEVQTSSSAPGILLVNDKFSPHWKVSVDGKDATLLRCNFIMRGAYVTAGNHTVRFQYRPPVNSLYVTLSAMLAGVLLLGVLVVVPGEKSKTVTP